jgi:serine/threonine protein kinase
MMAEKWAKSKSHRKKKEQADKKEKNESGSDQPSPEGSNPSLPELPKPNGVMSRLNDEVKLLMRLNHPNIIKVYQVIDSEHECFIVMYI